MKKYAHKDERFYELTINGINTITTNHMLGNLMEF